MRHFVGTPLSARKEVFGNAITCKDRPSFVKRPTTSPIRMSLIAPPVSLDVKAFEGNVVGSETLSLKVAEPDKAKGLVHRYLVKVRRDMRAVNSHLTFKSSFLKASREMQALKREAKSEAEAKNPSPKKEEAERVAEATDHLSSLEGASFLVPRQNIFPPNILFDVSFVAKRLEHQNE